MKSTSTPFDEDASAAFDEDDSALTMSRKPKVILAVHGGAGIIQRESLTPELEREYCDALKVALRSGFDVLNRKIDDNELSSANVAVDAAEAAVKSLENCPLFNAGRGSVFASDGKIRMDASIMGCYLDNVSTRCEETDDGQEVNKTKITSSHQIIQERKYPIQPHPRAGAVAGVSNIQNPIMLARQVMERTPHVMLIGKGAEDFAKTLPPEVGVKFQPDGYFCTERRWTQLEDVREMESRQKQGKDNVMMFQLDHASAPSTAVTIERGASKECEPKCEHDSHKFGTVGSVALYQPDPKSNGTHRAQLASATSTGGMTNQRYHRVGDSPVIGAGTYANSLCAVSCTGHGEWFIRCVAAHDVAKRLEYKYSDYQDRGSALEKAVDEVVNGSLRGDDENGGGAGGLIALDRDGNFYADMNCSGMYHAWLYENGDMVTRIFSDKKKECQNC